MEERIWRVKALYGYRDVFFDFDSAEEASDIINICALHFNKENANHLFQGGIGDLWYAGI